MARATSLFADAGLAPDEDGGVGVGDLVDHFFDGLHAGAVFEGAVVLGAAALELAPEHLLAQPLHLPLQRGLLQHVVHRAAHLLPLERLRQKVAGSQFHRFDHGRRLAEGGNHDHRGARAGVSNPLQHHEPVLVGQAHVQEHQGRLQLLRPLQPLGPVSIVFGLMPELTEHADQRLSNFPIIVNDQNRRNAHGTHLLTRPTDHDARIRATQALCHAASGP